VRTVEGDRSNAVEIVDGRIGFGIATDEDGPLGESRERRDSDSEVLLSVGENHRRIGRQGIRVHRPNEERIRDPAGIRNVAKRACAQGRPLARLEESVDDLSAIETQRLVETGLGEVHRRVDRVPIVERDGHGDRLPPLFALGRRDDARPRRREADSRMSVIDEERLSQANSVAG
jgi:hypothetical protein